LLVHLAQAPSHQFATPGAATAAGAKGMLPRSRYRGVTWDAATKAWRATVKVKGKPWYLGSHKRELDAAKAYDVACWFLTGNKTKVNFAEQDYDAAELPRQPPPWLEKYLLEQHGADGADAKHRTEVFKRWLLAVTRRGLGTPSGEGFVYQDGAFHSLGGAPPALALTVQQQEQQRLLLLKASPDSDAATAAARPATT
jgi:hypothetical protein